VKECHLEDGLQGCVYEFVLGTLVWVGRPTGAKRVGVFIVGCKMILTTGTQLKLGICNDAGVGSNGWLNGDSIEGLYVDGTGRSQRNHVLRLRTMTAQRQRSRDQIYDHSPGRLVNCNQRSRSDAIMPARSPAQASPPRAPAATPAPRTSPQSTASRAPPPRRRTPSRTPSSSARRRT
jgi:hypothetical protein